MPALLLVCLLAGGTPGATREPEVKGVLDAWLAAQNAGDFAAYQKLYAPKFSGIKRVGKRKSVFDRAGWMIDRGKMFKKPFRVQSAGVHFAIGKSGATISFTQSWFSGAFSDEGPKRIAIVRSDGADGKMLITREEMLESKVWKKSAGGKNVVVRWIIGGEPGGEMSATLVLEGAVSRQYDIGLEEGCSGAGPAGMLGQGVRSSFACSKGDCATSTWVERKGRHLVVMESTGCQVGAQASETKRVVDDFSLAADAAVEVKVEKAGPDIE
jgi:hypothetical protein